MRAFAPKQKPVQKTKLAGYLESSRALSVRSHEVSPLLRLQRTIGNQAVQPLLQAKPDGVEVGSDTRATARFGHDFSRIPVYARTPARVQTKLTVNSPEDVYEQEADRVTDQVMRMPEPQLQRSCPCGGGCPKCQAGKLDQETERLQRNRVQSSGTGGTAVPPIVHDVLSSPGRPLDPAMRGFMEPRFGHDFGQVRVHVDSEAAGSAEVLNARAFTNGRHIVFGRSEYAPGTMEGKRIIAHELAHVVQQGNTGWHLRGQGTERKPSEQVMRKEQKKRDPAPAIEPERPAKSWFYPDDPTGHVASIYFDTNSSKFDVDDLDADDRDEFYKVVNLLKDPNPPTRVMFEGYSDMVGGSASNKALSKQRAEAVAAWFPLATPHTTVEVIDHGEQGPEPTADNAAQLSHYRRVDVIIVPPRETTRHEPPRGRNAQDRSPKLNRAVSRARDALDDTFAALTTREPSKETSAALERYFPHQRYRSAEFIRILALEIEHILNHIESIHYDEFNPHWPKRGVTDERIADLCRDMESPRYDNDLCLVLKGDVASAFPLDAPNRIVLTPKWYDLDPSVPASLLVHEAAHLLLGHRGHPTKVPHRDPYAIQGFVAKLGSLTATESDRRYPEPAP